MGKFETERRLERRSLTIIYWGKHFSNVWKIFLAVKKRQYDGFGSRI
jgi:hypothetical protein